MQLIKLKTFTILFLLLSSCLSHADKCRWSVESTKDNKQLNSKGADWRWADYLNDKEIDFTILNQPPHAFKTNGCKQIHEERTKEGVCVGYVYCENPDDQNYSEAEHGGRVPPYVESVACAAVEKDGKLRCPSADKCVADKSATAKDVTIDARYTVLADENSSDSNDPSEIAPTTAPAKREGGPD